MGPSVKFVSPNKGLISKKNIARGTTDPGYRVYNLNYLFDWIEFVFIQAAEMTQVLISIPWVRCASSDVSTLPSLMFVACIHLIHQDMS